jgi:hypothetical protein
MCSCSKEEKHPEPEYVLGRWARAIKDLDYASYSRCEAYPKSEDVFREMYRDFYYSDVMLTDIDKPDRKDVRRDHEDNPYIHRSVSFEGNVVRRGSTKPYQVIRGDVVFIRFTGKRSQQGWMMSNRTLVNINR